jgi:hypothetical protein
VYSSSHLIDSEVTLCLLRVPKFSVLRCCKGQWVPRTSRHSPLQSSPAIKQLDDNSSDSLMDFDNDNQPQDGGNGDEESEWGDTGETPAMP